MPANAWMLAFDATCCTCRKMSDVVADACDNRLEVVPLDRSDIKDLRSAAFAGHAPHAPTLIRVAADGVTAWTGVSMALPLSRQLGARRGLTVLRALGAATQAPRVDQVEQQPASGLNRRAFVQLGAGAAVAAGLLVAGRKPAAFATPADKEVAAWVARNRHNLPTQYHDVVNRPLAYRKAIYNELGPKARSDLWVAQLREYEKALPAMTPAQRRALDHAQATFASPAVFATDSSGPTPAAHKQLRAVRTGLESAFGPAQAHRMIGTLALPTQSPAAQPGTTDGVQPNAYLCECNPNSDYCAVPAGSAHCVGGGCVEQSGCGSAYQYRCNGICYG